VKKPVLFAYISKDNQEFIKSLKKQSNQTISFCADTIITEIRKRKNFQVPKTEPKYVKNAKAWEKRNLA